MKKPSQQELYWRCRRGMKELDLLLIPYIEREYAHLTDEELKDFIELLELPDPEIYALLLNAHASDRLSPRWVRPARAASRVRGI